MTRRNPITKNKFLILLLVLLQLGIYGCQPKVYYPFDSIQYSDKDIVEFNNRLSTMMRRNMNWNAIVRYASSVIVIGAAATAGALGIAGVSTEIVGFTALGGGFIAEMQGIFNTRDKARAFQQGVELMEEASARYLKALALDPKSNGRASNSRLTNSGARLFEESLASLKLVEITLIAEIPTIAEVQKAAGKYQQLNIFPEHVEYADFALSADGKTKTLEIKALEGGPIVDFSSPVPSVVSVKRKKDNNSKIVLTFHGDSKTTRSFSIMLINGQNVKARVGIGPRTSTEQSEDKKETTPPALAELQSQLKKKTKEIEDLKSVIGPLRLQNRTAKESETDLDELIKAAELKKKVAQGEFKDATTADKVRNHQKIIDDSNKDIADYKIQRDKLKSEIAKLEKADGEAHAIKLKMGELFVNTLKEVETQVMPLPKKPISSLPMAPDRRIEPDRRVGSDPK